LGTKPQRSVAAFEAEGVARGLLLRERAELLDEGLLILLRPGPRDPGRAQQNRGHDQDTLRPSTAHDRSPPSVCLSDRAGTNRGRIKSRLPIPSHDYKYHQYG